MNTSGNTAYYASNREDGCGRLDIYRLELYPEARPTPVTYVKGRVSDASTKKSLYAEIELVNLETGRKTTESRSDPVTGIYLVCIPVGFDYAFNTSRPGYLFFSESFMLKEVKTEADPYRIDIALQPIQKGKKVVLKNIFFETDSYKLKSQSDPELEIIKLFLQDNPGVVVEIGGHTDSVGTAAYNMTLSGNRAEAVYNALIEKGVQESQLNWKGYGFSVPVAPNKTPEGRALNRRTEIKIIKTGN